MKRHLAVLPAACCTPGAPPLPSGAADDLARRFKALSDPTRVAIVNRLAQCDECCVCTLVEESDLSQPTVSHPLKILRDAGLVESTRRGTWAWYRLVPDAIAGLAAALGGYPAEISATPARAVATPAR